MKKVLQSLSKIFIIASFFLIVSTTWSSNDNRPKILVLIICSDQLPVYLEFQKIWRAYMHLDPEHIEAYFLKGDPSLESNYKIEGDIIWAKATEGWVPQSSGILDKTIFAFEAMLNRIDEFDFIYRTNLSSFIYFPNLLNFAKSLPKSNCYCGKRIAPHIRIASGSGFFISPDLAKQICFYKSYFIGEKEFTDDVKIGHFMYLMGIQWLSSDRIDFLNMNDWHLQQANIPSNTYHFRTKCPDELRSIDDIYIHKQLLRKYYGINFNPEEK